MSVIQNYLTMILVTVGTEQYPFDALMNWIDILIRYGFIDANEEVLIQYGSSSKLPDQYQVKGFSRLPESEFKVLLSQARIVISHCGEGSSLLLASLNKPHILVPRTKRFGEHVDDHQLEMADFLENQGISVARSPGDLVRFLAAPKTPQLISPQEDKLCRFLSQHYPQNKYKKLMVICSSGGHFTYAQSLKPFLNQYQDLCWITFYSETTKAQLQADQERVYWAYSPTNRNLPNLIRNLILAFKVLICEQPDLVLSTGAGVSVPFLLLARFLFKKPTVFVESKTRLTQLSLSAKMLHFLEALEWLVVRSQMLANFYPNAEYVDTESLISEPHHQEEQTAEILKGQEIALLSTPADLGMKAGLELQDSIKAFYQFAPKRIVIDMSLTQSMNSAGLGALFQSLKVANSLGSNLVIWSANPRIIAILAKSKLLDSLIIEPGTSTMRVSPDHLIAKKRSVASEIDRVLMRCTDISVALMAMVILAIVIIPIAVGIALDHPGKIMVTQTRCGFLGKPFRIWKFRSTPSTQSSPVRMAWFLQILAKTHLDKLPMFWNVLMGDMTLVGPRSPSVDEVEHYSIKDWQALDIKPGISGEWDAISKDCYQSSSSFNC